MMSETPTFEEWVEYCFTQKPAKRASELTWAEHQAAQELEERYGNIPPSCVAEYLSQLFRAPAWVAERYSDDAIGAGTWFLFGPASGYFWALERTKVATDVQAECVSALATLYTELYDRVCCKHGTDPDGRYANEIKLDIAVYMIWESLEGAVFARRKTTEVAEAGWEVLEAILTRCRTSTCLQSALHGLGHLEQSHSERCGKLIGRFLRRGGVPSWLREYAQAAQVGHVQ